MTQILSFLAAYMGFLWEGARFRITDSVVATSNGGDSLLVVESSATRLRFVQDRTQLFLDVQAVAGPASEWFSIDLLRRLYTGRREYSAVLDESYADFVHRHLTEIDERLGPDQWQETYRELRKLKDISAKERFG